MDNVVELPPREDIAAKLFGPIREGNTLILDGRAVPRVSVHDKGETIYFVLDDRMGFEFSRESAYLAASFAANAMAVGAGFASVAAEGPKPFFAPPCHGISGPPE